MSGSIEVRDFLLRAGGAEGVHGGVPAPRNGQADAQRISDDQVSRARLAVATGAVDPQDCHQLLEMLGLLPEGDEIPPVQR